MNPAGVAPVAGGLAPPAAGGAAAVGPGMAPLTDGNRASQYVAALLTQNWNPEGWRRELTLQERVQTIMDMCVRASFCLSLSPRSLPRTHFYVHPFICSAPLGSGARPLACGQRSSSCSEKEKKKKTSLPPPPPKTPPQKKPPKKTSFLYLPPLLGCSIYFALSFGY